MGEDSVLYWTSGFLNKVRILTVTENQQYLFEVLSQLGAIKLKKKKPRLLGQPGEGVQLTSHPGAVACQMGSGTPSAQNHSLSGMTL